MMEDGVLPLACHQTRTNVLNETGRRLADTGIVLESKRSLKVIFYIRLEMLMQTSLFSSCYAAI